MTLLNITVCAKGSDCIITDLLSFCLCGQTEEFSASQRDLKEKDREISGHMDRIRRLEADNDKLRDEVDYITLHH